MPSKPKKTQVSSRALSPNNRNCRSKPTIAHDQGEGSWTAAPGPSLSAHPPAHLVPHLSPPVDNSTPQSDGSQPPTRRSRRRRKKKSSQSTALSTPRHDGSLQLPQMLPVQQPYNNPRVQRAQGGATSFCQGASGFQMDLQYIEANNVTVHTGGGADDTPIGTSIPPRA